MAYRRQLKGTHGSYNRKSRISRDLKLFRGKVSMPCTDARIKGCDVDTYKFALFRTKKEALKFAQKHGKEAKVTRDKKIGAWRVDIVHHTHTLVQEPWSKSVHNAEEKVLEKYQ